LLREMEKRKDLFGKAGVTKLKDYREATGTSLPAIVVVVDNYANFHKAYEEHQQHVEQTARDGGSLGVHLIITANSSTAVRFGLRSLITMNLALSLADVSEYSDVVGRTEGLIPDPVPGRGLVKGKPPLEFQGAVPVDRDTDAERTKALRELIGRMHSAWGGPVAHPIRTLPKVIPLSDLISPGTIREASISSCGDLSVPLGLYVEDLEPMTVDLSKTAGALVLGRPKGGKTSFLQTWLVAMASLYPPDCLDFYLLDSRRKGLLPLSRLPHVKTYSYNPKQFNEIVRGIPVSTSQSLSSRPKFTVVAVDDMWSGYDNEISGAIEDGLANVVLRGEEAGVRLILTTNNGDFKKWSPLAKALMNAGDIFLIGHSEDSAVELDIPYGSKNKVLPPGEGYFQKHMQTLHIKVATVHSGKPNLEGWIESVVARVPGRPVKA